nr:hypothetical protein [Tanacetum cinerariifolium]GFC15279.1 hypothetical protein [Tanacetum cinerariifolium]
MTFMHSGLSTSSHTSNRSNLWSSSCIDSIQVKSAIASLMFLGSVRLTKDIVDRKCAYLTNQHDVMTSPLDDMTVGEIVGS